MTDDDIKRWAAEAGMDELTGWRDEGPTDTYFEAWPEQLRKFAELVAEDCAKLVEEAHAEDYSAPAGARAIREKFEIKG